VIRPEEGKGPLMLFSTLGKWLARLLAPTPQASSTLQKNAGRRRRGATAMEYLAVISLIFIAAMTAINYFGQATKNTFDDSSSSIEKATNASQSGS
jgi:Flp pilus assembly pilin Flp